jgi:hypothetical protein
MSAATKKPAAMFFSKTKTKRSLQQRGGTHAPTSTWSDAESDAVAEP